MKQNLVLVILFILVIFLDASKNYTYAQGITISEHDLSSDWKVFKESTRTFHDFGRAGRSKSVRLSLAVKENADGWLQIEAPAGTNVVINGSYYSSVEKILKIELDSLVRATNRNFFDFNIYRQAGLNHTNLSTVLYERVPFSGDTPVERKRKDGFMDFYVLGSMVILMFIGFLSRKFPRDTHDYFSFQRSISFKNREETLISSRPFNRTNILFIILDSFLIGFLIVSLVHLATGHVYFPFINKYMDFPKLITGWILASITVFLSIVIKYILLSVFAGMFRLGEFRYIQHFNLLRFSIGAFLLIFLLTTITYFTFRTEGLQAYFVFTRILAGLLFLRITIMFLKLRDFASFRNFHLFSYLCGTEIIPFIILYKLVLG